MKCPACSSINPDNAVKCQCGYDFTTNTKPYYRSFSYMSVGEFFSNSWRIYGVALGTFLLLGAIYTVLSRGLSLGAGVIPSVVSIIISLIALILTTMALTMAAHKASEGEVIGIGESYSLSLGLFGRYIITIILYFLIVLGGLILFIIPGIIWGIRYVLAPYVVIIEGISGKKALSRSAALIKGKVFGIGVREFVFILGFTLVVAIPLALLTWLIAAALGQPFPSEFSVGPGFDIQTSSISQNPEWAEAIQTFGSSIWEGLFIIFNVLLFKSLCSLDGTIERGASKT